MTIKATMMSLMHKYECESMKSEGPPRSGWQVKRKRSSDVFQIPQGEVDGHHAGVDTPARSDPDWSVDVERRSQELALLLGFGVCRIM